MCLNLSSKTRTLKDKLCYKLVHIFHVNAFFIDTFFRKLPTNKHFFFPTGKMLILKHNLFYLIHTLHLKSDKRR